MQSRSNHAWPTFGYHGRYLRIDSTLQQTRWRTIPDTIGRQYLGGTGLGVYLMLIEKQATVQVLTPDACLAFVFSPLVGSPLTTSAKFAVVCKSPLTHRYNDSLASSSFAIAGKRAGFDAIVLTGRAARPSILVIDDGKVEWLDAQHVWGATTSETQDWLKHHLDQDFQFSVIGPAGENGVLFATISHDGRHAGRGGSGAVMGAMNLKAIAVRGQKPCEWANRKALYEYAKELSARSMGPATAKYRELGTATNLLTFNRLKTLPTRNFQQGSFSFAEQLAPETLTKTHAKTRASCAACTIGCEHIYSLGLPSDADKRENVRLEYESLFALGSLCDVGDPDLVLKASRRCDELGCDTISAGVTIACAMELVERGWLDEPWLRFGDGSAVVRAIELIGRREEIGARLAEGSRRLAEPFGPEAEKFAAHVKGLEISGYEPRGTQTQALGFAVTARGADHNRSGGYEADFSEAVDRRRADERSVAAAIVAENQAALLDSLIICRFLRGVFADLYVEAAKMLQYTCGWPITAAELQQTTQRIVAARKLFNIQAGWQPAEDTLPDRFFQSPLADDPVAKLDKVEFGRLVQRYNQERGWTSDGWIPDKELQRLGLDAFANGVPQPASSALSEMKRTS